MNLCELLDGAVHRWPGKPALIEGAHVLTYEGLGKLVAELAVKLRTLGLPRQTLVGLRYPNGINYVALTFALWQIDAVVVPIPAECTQDEVASLAETLHLDVILAQKDPGDAEPFFDDGFLTRRQPESTAAPLPPQTAFIRFTSGTTSTRKGVVLTHASVRDRVRAANTAFQIGPQDTVMWCLPMSHHFLITIILYLSEGTTTVLTKLVVPKAYLEEAARHRATVLYATPFQYSLLAAAGPGQGLDSVRLAVSTTCGLSEEVAKAFNRAFGVPLTQALGVIELGLVSLNSEDPLGRWNSVGRPHAHEVRIVNPDETGGGDVEIRGPGLLDAYAAPWLPREKLLHDGWFRTGDMGRLDADGFLFLLGRSTAVINLAGRKVFPEEIEEVLNRHPSVLESRVFGRAHPHLGEVVEAEVVWDSDGPDPEGLRAWCRQHLAAYKIPTGLHAVEALPKTPVTGKILRAVAVA